MTVFPGEVYRIIPAGSPQEITAEKIDLENTEPYVGTYEVAPGTDLIISAENGTLMLTVPGQNPIGIDAFADGTRGLWEPAARADAFSLIGGGDTIAAARRFGVADKVSYICTAGGGLILFLSGKKLPVVEALAKHTRTVTEP